MRELILDIIKRLSDDKKSKHIEPSAVLYSEISTEVHKEVQAILNQLIKDGELSWHRTLNQMAFEIKNK